MRDLFSSHTQSDGIPDKTHRIAVLRRLRADTERRLQEATERAEGLAHAVQSERKGRFMDKLRAIGASASEASLSSHAHGKDARRGLVPAVPNCPIGDVLGAEYPPVRTAAVADAWAEFLAAAVTITDADTTGERAVVHPVMLLLVRCALGDDGAVLKMWYEALAEDDFPTHNIIPDISFSALVDRTLSTIGLHMSVECKRKYDLASALLQAGNYSRRTVCVRTEEADARGDGDVSKVWTLAAGSDAKSIAFVRTASGAPAPGVPYDSGMEPCPMHESEPLARLGDAFDRLTGLDVSKLPRAAPLGFQVLVRVLRAGDYLVSQAPPLTSCACIETEEVIPLEGRLGSGGVSDVYGVAGRPSECVKIPRVTTASVVSAFKNEASVLHALRSPHIPRLARDGTRRVPILPLAVPWPYLVISPRGHPLAEVVRTLCAKYRTKIRLDTALRSLAACVVRGVVAALRVGHGARKIHGDVRPQNVVLLTDGELGVDTTAILADWALCTDFGNNIKGLGQELYTADRVRTQQSCIAAAWVDLVGAAYTWVAIVYGSGGRAPWRTVGGGGGEREKWFAERARADGDVARVAEYIRTVAKRGGRVDYDGLVQIAVAAAEK